MRFDVVTIFPELVAAVGECGVVGRAIDSQRAQLATWNPREFADNRYRRVDDRTYGGGPGMVMQAAPLAAAVEKARSGEEGRADVVYLSPQGQRFDQALAEQFAQRERLILIAGRYEGVDERFIDRCVDMEVSVGDFVLSGGELAAMMVVDAVTRLLPGVLGHKDSAAQDSFSSGLLDCPHYTRPEQFEGHDVPQVLLSGDHEAIRRWRLEQSLVRTHDRRPDLLADLALSAEAETMLNNIIASDGKHH